MLQSSKSESTYCTIEFNCEELIRYSVNGTISIFSLIQAWFHDQMIQLVDFKHIYLRGGGTKASRPFSWQVKTGCCICRQRNLKVLMEDRNEGHSQSPHTKRGEVQSATNHATSCDSWQVLETYLNTQWHRQWLQNLALLYRKGNDGIHQHAHFDCWLRRFPRRCSCRACCAGGRLVCGGNNVETMMCTIWVRARAGRRHRWKVVFGARARAKPSTDVAAVPLVL